jgi:DNA-binding protein Fis
VDQTLAEYVRDLLARARNGELDHVLDTVSEMVDRELYAQAIHRAGGDQSKAARWLGVSRPTMLDKLTKLGLRPAGS